MIQIKEKYNAFLKVLPNLLQLILNTSLIILALILSFLLVKELIDFAHILYERERADYSLYLANILIFFLYFEFISMIVKYFRENYHFPMRYFLYIGITAMTRLIIVEHDDALKTLFYAFVILILIIGYFIMNITPRERPEVNHLFRISKKAD